MLSGFAFKLTRAVLVLTMIFGGSSFLLMAAARQQDPPQLVHILMPDSSCADSPCWYGINTNENEHAETVERIMSLPNAVQNGILEWDFFLNGQQHVRLEGGRDLILLPQNLRLGDVVLAVGTGDAQVRGSAYVRDGSFSGYYISFYYHDARMILTVLVPLEGRLSPLTPVYEMVYLAGVYPDPTTQHPWVGFVQMEDYPIQIYDTLVVFDPF